MSEEIVKFPCRYCKHFQYLEKFGGSLWTHCKKCGTDLGMRLHENFCCGKFKINKLGKKKCKEIYKQTKMLEKDKK